MGQPVHVIIADDEDGVRAVLVHLIRQTYPSATISAFSDGLAALTAYDQHYADLVITNQSMPQMSGLDLITALRTRTTTLPIIMVSGDFFHEQAALAAGATAFVAKPFTRAQLAQTLRRVLPP